MESLLTGLDRINQENDLKKKFKGNIAYLCHQASVDKDCRFGVDIMKEHFSDKLIKLFGPQHGLMTDLQENMIETDHQIHPYYKLPVYSLYSETRKPTKKMLEEVDHLFIDLQDIGTRIYTYIYTLYYAMEAAQEEGIQIVVLDRPNPMGGVLVDGNILEDEYKSFVGLIEFPLIHGMTMGEIAHFYKKHFFQEVNLEIIKMKNWSRELDLESSGYPWVPPSPNIPSIESCFTFPLTVIYEGTNLTEGRGTTRPLECVGHPKLKAHQFCYDFEKKYPQFNKMIKLRATYIRPTHHKWENETCGGVHFHILDRKNLPYFEFSHLICRELKLALKDEFKWIEPPYEYEYTLTPIDIINGSNKVREWIEQEDSSLYDLTAIKEANFNQFLHRRMDCLLY